MAFAREFANTRRAASRREGCAYHRGSSPEAAGVVVADMTFSTVAHVS
jgi:hypothetical protein